MALFPECEKDHTSVLSVKEELSLLPYGQKLDCFMRLLSIKKLIKIINKLKNINNEFDEDTDL